MPSPFPDLIGDCAAIQAVRSRLARLLEQIARTARWPTVLFLGETGTGKGLLARALHRASRRDARTFLALNCAAIPAPLVEAELFGVTRGAFTGAREARPGLFREAHGGTLFLDEIGALPVPLQAKLLTAIEMRAVRPLGSSREEAVDVWLLSATNADLARAVQEGRFREDLYHRLATIQVTLPALRERGPDILALARHYLGRACAEYTLPPKTLEAEARAALLAYSWPGNVRELSNVIERAALLTGDGLISAAELGLPEIRPTSPGDMNLPLGEALAVMERSRLRAAWDETGGNLSEAARRLGMPRNTLRYRLGRLGLTLADPVGATGPTSIPVRSASVEPIRSRAVILLDVTYDGAGGDDLARAPWQPRAELTGKIAAFGGEAVTSRADGFVAAFGLEPAEDAPFRAASAALAIRAAVRRRPPDDPAFPRVRLVLHAAPMPIGPEPMPPPGLSARNDRTRVESVLNALRAQAVPDEIIVTEAVRLHLERHFALTRETGLDEAGHARPESASSRGSSSMTPEVPSTYRLIGREPTGLGLGGRPLSRLAGRDRELDSLEDFLARARAGTGQAVVLIGEPGVGKSRLLFEFRERLRAVAGTWLEGRCTSSGTASPYGALMEAMRQALILWEDDGPEAIAAAARKGLESFGLEPELDLPYLQALLAGAETKVLPGGLSPEAIRRRTFEALHRFLLAVSVTGPLVLAIEDLHWIDPTSEAYLTELVDRLAAARILLVATSRPGTAVSWLRRSHVSQLALPPLSRAASLVVVRSIAPTDRLSDVAAAAIVSRADGNPFFLEELSWAALAEGGNATGGAAPRSLTDVLQMRIDRLPPAVRRVLSVASVLGREFPTSLLHAVSSRGDTLEGDLATLKQLELVHDQPQATEPTLVFKHALTQEAAYARLSPDERRSWHEVTAQHLERLHADRLALVEDRLAYHYARTDRADRAIHYLLRVAQRASRSYALPETLVALREARGHAERLPAGSGRDRAVLEICVRQGLPLLLLGRTGEFLARFLPEAERLERVSDPGLASHYHAWVALAYNQVGNHARSVGHGQCALEMAEATQDPVGIARAHYLLAVAAYWASRYREGIAYGRAGEAVLERVPNPFWAGHLQWSLGLNHALLGEFDRALEAFDKLRRVAEATGDPRMQSFAAMKRGFIHTLAGRTAEGVAECAEGLRLAGNPFDAAMARMLLGYAYLEHGQAAEAIRCLASAVRELDEAGIQTSAGWMRGYLAEAYLAVGDLERARGTAAMAMAVTNEARYPYGLGVAQRALGRVSLAAGDIVHGETRLAGALATFSAIEAAREVGCTQLLLAEAAHARGRRDTAAIWLRDAAVGLARLPGARLADRTRALARALA